jgi:hypothetical protein
MSRHLKEMRLRVQDKIWDARSELRRSRVPRGAPEPDDFVSVNRLNCLANMIEDLLDAERAIDKLRRAEAEWTT